MAWGLWIVAWVCFETTALNKFDEFELRELYGDPIPLPPPRFRLQNLKLDETTLRVEAAKRGIFVGTAVGSGN